MYTTFGDFPLSSRETFFRLARRRLHDELADFGGSGESALAAHRINVDAVRCNRLVVSARVEEELTFKRIRDERRRIELQRARLPVPRKTFSFEVPSSSESALSKPQG